MKGIGSVVFVGRSGEDLSSGRISECVVLDPDQGREEEEERATRMVSVLVAIRKRNQNSPVRVSSNDGSEVGMARVGGELGQVIVAQDDVANDSVSILDEEVGDRRSVRNESGSDGAVGSVDGDGGEGSPDESVGVVPGRVDGSEGEGGEGDDGEEESRGKHLEGEKMAVGRELEGRRASFVLCALVSSSSEDEKEAINEGRWTDRRTEDRNVRWERSRSACSSLYPLWEVESELFFDQLVLWH